MSEFQSSEISFECLNLTFNEQDHQESLDNDPKSTIPGQFSRHWFVERDRLRNASLACHVSYNNYFVMRCPRINLSRTTDADIAKALEGKLIIEEEWSSSQN